MKVCLFSYPRTGTSVVFRLMSRYLNAKHGSGLGVGEIFDCGDHLLVDTGTGLKLEDGNATEHYRQEISRRIELLKKYDRQNYSIKVLANQANHGVIEFLAEHYQIVCLERRDQFEAVLSWILARQTGFWSIERGGVRPKISKIVAEREIYEEIRNSIVNYLEMKPKFPSISKTLIYEDFVLLQNKTDVLKELGWTDVAAVLGENFDEVILRSFEEGEKQGFVENLNEVRGWYENDFC